MHSATTKYFQKLYNILLRVSNDIEQYQWVGAKIKIVLNYPNIYIYLIHNSKPKIISPSKFISFIYKINLLFLTYTIPLSLVFKDIYIYLHNNSETFNFSNKISRNFAISMNDSFTKFNFMLIF